MKASTLVTLLLFLVGGTSFAQGRLDINYGRHTEKLGISNPQKAYLGNSIGLEYTRSLGSRWAISSGLRYSGWLLDEEKEFSVNLNKLVNECDCIHHQPIIPSWVFVYYSSRRLEIPFMLSYKLDSHSSMPFAVRVGVEGLIHRYYERELIHDAPYRKSFHPRLTGNIGLQIPVLRKAKAGIYLEPYLRFGREIIDPNRLTLDLPIPEMRFDYGIKVGLSVY